MTSKELQTLKYQRLSEPEKIILESFKGLKEYVNKYDSNWVYYKSDKGLFYMYCKKTKWLRYDNDLIYSKIYSYFDNYQKADDVIEELIVKHLKLKVVTTNTFSNIISAPRNEDIVLKQ